MYIGMFAICNHCVCLFFFSRSVCFHGLMPGSLRAERGDMRSLRSEL